MANFFTGSRGKMKKAPTKTPQQLALFNQAAQQPITTDPNYQSGSSYLQRLLSNDPAMMEQFSAPYLRQFNEDITPGIAERFAGMGTGGSGLSSSGLNNALAQAAQRLQESLASMRSQQQLQGAQLALPYAQQPYNNLSDLYGQQLFTNYQQAPQQGFLQPLATAAGGALAGPLGAYAGSQLSNMLSGQGGGFGGGMRPGVSVG
jgi:hypothetical protein